MLLWKPHGQSAETEGIWRCPREHAYPIPCVDSALEVVIGKNVGGFFLPSSVPVSTIVSPPWAAFNTGPSIITSITLSDCYRLPLSQNITLVLPFTRLYYQ